MSEIAAGIQKPFEGERVSRQVVYRLSARQWFLHLTFFLATALTTTFSGIVWTAGPDLLGGDANVPANDGVIGSIFLIPVYYLRWIESIVREALLHPAILLSGLKFSLPLLTILAAHESGHYLFCRYYGVDATPPFFIPQPPGLFPGTFGAFIKMKSPVPSRRALFDIGLAGPLAGFILIIPVALLGVLTLQHVPLVAGQAGDAGPSLTFNDPLLFRMIAKLFRIDLDNSLANPFYLAAWVGALVTALNLMPVGQLDGGHGTFASFGPRAHHWIGRIAFVSMAVISILGWWWHGSPAGFVYVVLLAVMLRVRHPQPERTEPLGIVRTVIGVVTLLVFAICFLPFPISIE